VRASGNRQGIHVRKTDARNLQQIESGIGASGIETRELCAGCCCRRVRCADTTLGFWARLGAGQPPLARLQTGGVAWRHLAWIAAPSPCYSSWDRPQLRLPGIERDTPTSRATSSALRPASICFNAPIICASVCLLFDILPPLSFVRNHTQLRAERRDRVKVRSMSRQGGKWKT
jgi:hypothetical protein